MSEGPSSQVNRPTSSCSHVASGALPTTRAPMQVLVTHSTSFVRASQQDAYGDILLRAGRFL